VDKQFESTYRLESGFSDNPGNLRKQKFVEDEQKRLQDELPCRPPNIKFFENIMYNRGPYNKDCPRIGYFCNMIPREIILALGAEPVRLDCGNSAAAVIGEEILSGEICPVVKATFGIFLKEDSLANSCDALILPTSCDAKRKMGQILNDRKSTFMLNLPAEQNHSLYSKQSYEEILRLVKFLESVAGKKLSHRLLKEKIRSGQKEVLLARKLQSLRIEKPGALSSRDLFLIIQSLQFRPSNPEKWIKETEEVIRYIENFKSERKNLRPRLILTGAPMIWPNFKVLNVLEECGAEIIADTLCTGVQCLYDPVIIDEGGKGAMLRALSNRYIYASICPCFISQTTRMNRILELVDECNADGVVNYSLRLCQLFDMESYRIEKTLRSKKISHINVRTDYSLEDTEQLRVRIEAFLETL
jgi:benzoyl-CoA reductase/2-hydroxyglutaryl-CoA dehydratase subunit BcrC/BadD/HgdB